MVARCAPGVGVWVCMVFSSCSLHRFLHFFAIKYAIFWLFCAKNTKKCIFFAFFSQKICTVQKKAVILHRDSEKEHTKPYFLTRGLQTPQIKIVIMKTTKQNPRDNKTNGKQFAYVLDSIDVILYDEKIGEYYSDDQTDENKIRYIVDKFNKEYNSEYNRKQYPNTAYRIGSWLRGLPSGISIAFLGYEIEKIGISWGYCGTKAKAAKFVSTWFEVMGDHIAQLANIFGVEINK